MSGLPLHLVTIHSLTRSPTHSLTPSLPPSVSEGHVWYVDYKKPECGEEDDCAYDIPSIEEASAAVSSLLDEERVKLVANGRNESEICTTTTTTTLSLLLY